MQSENDTFQDGPEALEWLRQNKHEAALASNRFRSTQEAINFVQSLYEAGALRIFVPKDSITDDEEEWEMGGPYSDTLIIEVSRAEIPEGLATLYCQEATLEGYDLRNEPPPLIDGRFLVLWWD